MIESSKTGILLRLCPAVIACAIATAAPLVAHAQESAGSRPSSSLLRLGGQPQPEVEAASDIFADGGIEEANREFDEEPARQAAPRIGLSEDGQSRAGAERRAGQVGVEAELPTGGARDNRREQPVEAGSPRPQERDPFLAEGLRAGSWRVLTRLDQSIGVTDNTARSAGGEAGAISRTRGNVQMRSDWSRHEASVEANAGLERSLGGDETTIPDADIAGDLRLDLLDGLSATLRGQYRYTTEATTSTQLGTGVAERPGVHAIGGSGEIARRGGRLQFSLRGSVDRTTYEPAPLTAGGELDQSDRDNTLFRLTGRAGYEISPAVTPFVQASIGRRLHDVEVDRNGDRRDSTIYDARAGVALDLGEKLRGEIAAGYLVEDFDGALETLSSPALNVDLTWSPQRETDVTLSASTTLAGSTTSGQSGSFTNSFSAAVEHRVRDRLSLLGNAGIDVNSGTAAGDDVTLSAGVGMRYWVNRFLGVTAGVDHQRFDAADPARSWQATTVTAGVTLQR